MRLRKSHCNAICWCPPPPFPFSRDEAQRVKPMQLTHDVDVAILKVVQGNTLDEWTICGFKAVCRKHDLRV